MRSPGAGATGPDGRTSVVVVTRNRRVQLLRALDELCALPEQPPVVVVDNGSADGTADAVARRHPGVTLLRPGHNLGAAGRTLGVRVTTTPYVAFSDDDSWWEPGALSRAADHLDAAPRLAVLAARILVGADGRLDPICTEMGQSPLPTEADLPGPPVLGFVACGAVVRSRAYLQVGGFSSLIFFSGEETLLSQDLAAAGWGLAYVDDVVARHHPVGGVERRARGSQHVRSTLLSAWMRRPVPVALRRTGAYVRQLGDGDVRVGLAAAGRRLPAALVQRRLLPADLEERVRLLERSAVEGPGG